MSEEKMKVWHKDFTGFEDLYDLERDISDAIEYEHIVPNGEWQGTLRVTMEYIPAEDEET